MPKQLIVSSLKCHFKDKGDTKKNLVDALIYYEEKGQLKTVLLEPFGSDHVIIGMMNTIATVRNFITVK